MSDCRALPVTPKIFPSYPISRIIFVATVPFMKGIDESIRMPSKGLPLVIDSLTLSTASCPSQASMHS